MRVKPVVTEEYCPTSSQKTSGPTTESSNLVPIIVGGPWESLEQSWERWAYGGHLGSAPHGYIGVGPRRVRTIHPEVREYKCDELHAPKGWKPSDGIPEGCYVKEQFKVGDWVWDRDLDRAPRKIVRINDIFVVCLNADGEQDSSAFIKTAKDRYRPIRVGDKIRVVDEPKTVGISHLAGQRCEIDDIATKDCLRGDKNTQVDTVRVKEGSWNIAHCDICLVEDE